MEIELMQQESEEANTHIAIALSAILCVALFAILVYQAFISLGALHAQNTQLSLPAHITHEHIVFEVPYEITVYEKITQRIYTIDEISLPYSLSLYELNALYRIVYAEARGEGHKGMVLVVNVIFNRLNHPYFPNDIIGVITDDLQFSPVYNGAFASANVNMDIVQAVHAAIEGADYSEGALWFRTIEGAAGNWHERTLERLFDYGRHRFYAMRD